jgi:CHAD domain-containing protein
VTRALGPVRELDVALQELGVLARRHRAPGDLVVAVRQVVEGERTDRCGDMRAGLEKFDADVLRQRSKDVAAMVRASSAHPSWPEAVMRHAAAGARRVDDAVDSCGTLYAPARLHTLRIAIKKLRYSLELADAMPALNDTMAVLRSGQRRLGHLHDMQVLLAAVRAQAERDGLAPTRPDFTPMVEALERECRRIHAALVPHLPAIEQAARRVERRLRVGRLGRRPSMARAVATAEEGATLTASGRAARADVSRRA